MPVKRKTAPLPSPSKRNTRQTKAKKKETATDVDIAQEESTADLPSGNLPLRQKQKTMPVRAKKNTNPGRIAQGPTRRTSAQMAADKAQEEEITKKQEAEYAANLEALARQNVAEDKRRALRKAMTIRKMADIPEYEDWDSGGEGEFKGLLDVDVEGNSTDDEDGMETQAPVAKPATKKTKQKTTQAKLTAIEEALKKKASLPPKENSKRKSKSGHLASGYDPTWLNLNKAKHGISKDIDTTAIGGFTDEDIFDERPIANPQADLKSQSSNQDVQVLQVDRRSEKQAGPVAVYTSKDTKKAKTRTSGPKIKIESKEDSGDDSSEPEIVSKAIKLTTKTVRSSHLPDFIHSDMRWASQFIPTAYYRLFISNAPFDEFSLSSPELPAIIQDLIQLIYGKNAGKYTVKGKQDPILLMVYNRCTSMRNTIGKLGVGAIEDHIKELSAADGKKWLLRAKRPDGPLFWETPCPEGCPISPKADGYQQPAGRMKSRFIIDIAKSALSFTKGAVTDFGHHPEGLFTLIAVALERGTKIAMGEKKTDFSGDNLQSRVVFFSSKLVSKVAEERWDEVLAECADNNMDMIESGNEMGDISMLDFVAGDVFDLTSPTKNKD